MRYGKSRRRAEQRQAALDRVVTALTAALPDLDRAQAGQSVAEAHAAQGIPLLPRYGPRRPARRHIQLVRPYAHWHLLQRARQRAPGAAARILIAENLALADRPWPGRRVESRRLSGPAGRGSPPRSRRVPLRP